MVILATCARFVQSGILEGYTINSLDMDYWSANFYKANNERVAANMIGVKKRVIIVNMGFVDVVMFNPVLLSKDTPYETEEGCLSLTGVRKTTRYENIEVEYYDMNWKKQRQKLSGWPAQICQHELDHLEGILI